MHKVGSVGVLLLNLEAGLVLEDNVADAGEGKPSEPWIHGPTLMKIPFASMVVVMLVRPRLRGYLNNSQLYYF